MTKANYIKILEMKKSKQRVKTKLKVVNQFNTPETRDNTETLQIAETINEEDTADGDAEIL